MLYSTKQHVINLNSVNGFNTVKTDHKTVIYYQRYQVYVLTL